MWEQLGAHRHIHHTRLKLYVLLAGVMKWNWKRVTQTMEGLKRKPLETNTSEGLDWKRSLALHLCFGSNLNSHIMDILGKYTDAFQEGDAPPPYPPHVECQSKKPSTCSIPFDTCYHLLQLYCQRDYSMELVLEPTASSPHPLDYRTRYIKHNSMKIQLVVYAVALLYIRTGIRVFFEGENTHCKVVNYGSGCDLLFGGICHVQTA